ncbi:MAG TPA: hypothetical protein VFF98_03145, partial [Novosphingobium sp.]|nr:hypothetical protein [Novosphingobium sp.]
MKFPALALALPLALLGAGVAGADPAPFDLAGPALRISVSRDGTSLPIAAVPQLAPGDRLTVEAPPPADATARYLLVAAFLRDPTNPPPAGWFARSESWKPARRGGGPIALTVPAGAHHLVLLLAPATGGDFATLKKAVAARPGAFVRAAQDLEQASLDRRRYDAYLAAIRKISASTPDALARLAPVVASSLHIKINQDCLQRQAELQAACLLDAKQSSVMGGDSTAGTSALSGAATDLALSLSATPAGGLGYYSPYISAIHEILGIFGAMHSAKYQYIPALGVPDGEALQLALNTPPSFGDPKSVLVAALPEIKPAQPPVPQLQPATPPAPALACLGGADPLPLALSPLFYATAYGHDLKLALHLPGGQRTELPLSADAARAGLVLAEPARLPAGLSGTISASLHGMWGFTRFAGPEMTLQTAGAWAWQQPEARKAEAGPLLLSGAPAACVSAITAAGADGIARPVSWKATESGALALTLPASPDRPEPLALTITGPAGTPPARLVVAPPARPAPPAARI